MAPSGGAPPGARRDENSSENSGHLRDSSPDYVQLNFDHRAQMNHHPSSRILTDYPTEMAIQKPKRGVKKSSNQNLNLAHHQALFQKHHQKALDDSQRIYQNYPMYTSREVVSHYDSHDQEAEYCDERDRQFATAICIFSSVLTMVLVLMFYLVGEAAFRSILLILSFVFFITLFLACFLRRPAAVVFNQNQNPNNQNNLNNNNNQNTRQTYHHQQRESDQKLFLIVPNSPSSPQSPESGLPNYRIVPASSTLGSQFCPIHHQSPEILSASSFTHTSSPSPPPPPIPPKSPQVPPTPPPIQTIPKRKTSVSSDSSLEWDSSEDIRRQALKLSQATHQQGPSHRE